MSNIKRLIHNLIIISVFICLCFAFHVTVRAEEGGRYWFFADSQEEAEAAALENGANLVSFSYGVAVVDALNPSGDGELSVSSGGEETAVYPNYSMKLWEEGELLPQNTVPSDENIYAQWHHEYIHDYGAWEMATGAGVTVAVLDTGIDMDHIDLKANIKGYESVLGEGETGKDAQGHGTMVAGIIAAASNQYFGCGVAPDAKLYSIQVVGEDGVVEEANVVRGLNRAIEIRADIVNMSLGKERASKGLLEAVRKARNSGILLVAAAGNNSRDVQFYPAAYDEVLGIGASSYDGLLSHFSNYGSWVSFLAPGGSNTSISDEDPTHYIWTTALGSQFRGMSGTSAACPIASGVAALVYSRNPFLIARHSAAGAEAVKRKLLASLDNRVYYSGDGSRSQSGCILADLAVEEEIAPLDVQDSIPFYFGDKSGFVSISSNQRLICRGRSVELFLTDENGNPIPGADKGAVSWEMSGDTSHFSLKDGRIRCRGSARAYPSAEAPSEVTVTATYNGLRSSISFMASERTKFYGFTDKEVKGNGKEKRLLRTSLNITCAVGDSISWNSLSDLVHKYNSDTAVVGIFYGKEGKGESARFLLTGTAESIGYAVKYPKKASPYISENENGDRVFVPLRKGRYSFIYTAADGSNKKFRVTFIVR